MPVDLRTSQETGHSTSILVAGSHLLSRIGIVSILDAESGLRVVGHASRSADIERLIAERRPDLVVLAGEADLPSAFHALAAGDPALGVLVVLSSRKRAGWRGQLPRVPEIKVSLTTMATLLPAVRLLRSGYQVATIDADEAGQACIPGQQVSAWERFEKLTEREAEIVRLILRGWDNAEIADALMLSSATIKSHVHNVMTKLDLRNRIDVIVTAYTTGIVRPGVPEPSWRSHFAGTPS